MKNKTADSYMMNDGQGGTVFDPNSEAGRKFIKWANEIAAAHDEPNDPLTCEKIELADDNVAEAFFHDATHIYYVRDEPNATLEYACSR